MLAAVLVLDGGIGMRSEVRAGVYTGRADGPFTYREGKAEAIRELAAREGIDLAASYAYSDSESDLPMMRAVGNPVAVNPDAALERTAKAEGWRIMRFDKLAPMLKIGLRWPPWRWWAGAAATRLRAGSAAPARLDFPDGRRAPSHAPARRAVHNVERRAGRAALRPRRSARVDRLPGRVPVHARRLSVDVSRALVDDAPVRGLRHCGGNQRALPATCSTTARRGSRRLSTCRR